MPEETKNLPARFDVGAAIATFTQTEADLTALAAKHISEVFDVSTTKGMVVAKEVRKTFRELRLSIEDTRKTAKADALAFGKKLDDHARKLQSIIADAEKNADDQIKAEENRKAEERAASEKLEQEAIARENALLDAIRDTPVDLIGKDSATIQAAIARLDAMTLDELTGAARERGVMLKAAAIAKSQSILDGVKSAEALKAAQAEQDAARARDEEAARVAKAEAEKAAQAKAEADRKAAQEKADQERRDRQAQEDADRAERQKREDAERAARQKATDTEAALLKAQREELAAEQKKLDDARLKAESDERERARKETEAKELARVQGLIDGAPPLRQAAINALTLLTTSGFAARDEAIQLKAAIEADAKPKGKKS